MSIPSSGAMVVVYRLPDFAVIATPVTHHAITVRPEKNGPGTFGVAIALDDPAHALIDINHLMAIRRDGQTTAAGLVEMIDERTIDEQGGARQVAVYSGALVGAVLEWGVVPPVLGEQAEPIEDDTVLDWRSNRYDMADDPWENSTEIMTVTAARAGGWPTPPGEQFGQKFTDSTGAFMIWHSSGDADDAPVGTCLFLFDVEITEPGRHVLEVLMDNEGSVWVDTVPQLEINQTEGYHVASFKRIPLSQHVHRLAFLVRNINGPASLAFNLFKADHQDRPMAGVPPVAISNSDVQVLEYPDPFPGMTVGDDLAQFLAENQALGALTWVESSFDKNEDSNGDDWDREVGLTTKTCTTSLVQFLDELKAAGRISRWRFRPDGVTLDVFKPGYSTRPGNIELEPAPVNDPNTGQVVELNRKRT